MYAVSSSSFNDSTWSSGLISLASSASVADQNLAALINDMLRVVGARISLSDDGTIVVSGLGTMTTGKKSPFSSSLKFPVPEDNKSSSGGGGGGDDREDPTLDEQKMVKHMEFVLGLIEDALDRNSAIMSRYETEGYITGMINQLEQEEKYLREKGVLYEEYLAKLKEEMDIRKEKLAGLTEGTQEYDDILAELEILQEAYQDYSLALLENENALLENSEAIKEHRDTIREMEIDLRNELLSAIEDREKREEESLNALIEMQDAILDAIIARHEKERDEIIRTTELKIEGLQEEIDALDEAFQKRKELNEEEDKATELMELEAQYARIIADPTRAKEALKIQNQILELRDEIAWDTAEDEVEAQKEALEDQITNLEDYQEYIENYYEDLLSNPRNFLDEVNNILSMSHEEIINWLKENTEEYQNSFDSSREQMVIGWQETLDTMDGIIRTHWEEIESIIAQGDAAILEFLQQNSQDYLEAGKLQAEAYTDAWLEQLEDLRRAYLDIYEEVNKHPFLETDATSTGDSSSGGGGGGGSSSKKTETSWEFWFMGSWKQGYKTREEALKAIETISIPSYVPLTEHAKIRDEAKKSLRIQGFLDSALTSLQNGVSSSSLSSALGLLSGMSSSSESSSSAIKDAKKYAENAKKYATGGLADYTGLAWLDGSPSAPERVLSPQQTKLFDSLVETLQKAVSIRGGASPYIEAVTRKDGSVNTFGDIIVNVDGLSSDEDYREMAEKVGEAILEQMNRGTVIGGIRYSF